MAYADSASSDSRKENLATVNAALRMQQALPQLNVYRGELILGMIGAKSKIQHTIVGDTVNRAARLESLCKELGSGIVISSEVFDDLDDELKKQFNKTKMTFLKGIEQQVKIHYL